MGNSDRRWTGGASAASLPEARNALLSAFAALTLSRRYDDFGVKIIIKTADVARSTFYYHFSGKDELLLENLKPFIEALACAPFQASLSPELNLWVLHIWEQRNTARRLLTGRTAAKLQAALVASLRERFKAQSLPELTTTSSSILAEQIAGASIALLQAWIGHRIIAPPGVIAGELWRLSYSAARDLS